MTNESESEQMTHEHQEGLSIRTPFMCERKLDEYVRMLDVRYMYYPLQVRKKTLVLKPLDLNSVPPFYKEHDARQPVFHLS